MTLGTTLQVPPEMWPPDRAAFDKYRQESLEKVHIDDAVREYLYPIAVARVPCLAVPQALRRLPESVALPSPAFCRNAFATRCGCRGMPPSNGASTGRWRCCGRSTTSRPGLSDSSRST